MRYNRTQAKEFYFWRTYDNQEIDLIEESSEKLSAFEFKWGDKKPSAPAAFTTAYPDASFEVINKNNYLYFIL